MKRTIKSGKFFRLIKTGEQFWIKSKLKTNTPSARRVSEKDARYLQQTGKSFDAACIFDFGCGVWARVTRITYHKYQ